MADEIASLGFKVDSGGLVQADQRLDRVTKSGKQTERQNERVADSFNDLSKAVGVAAAALATVGVGANVVDDIFNFDSAVKALQATSRATAQEMEALETQARSLGATTQFSATQVADAQRFLAQAGFDTNEILKSTAETLKLATAGNLDVAEAADIASNVMGGMGLEVQDLSRVIDVMAEAASASNTDVRQLSSALSNAAPIATSAGVSMEELTAAIGTLSDSGIQAEKAGTAIVGIMRQLSNVTPQAQKILSKYGLTMADVSIESVGLSKSLENIGNAGLSSGEAIKLFGSEAAAAGLTLSSMTQKLDEQTQRFNQAKGSASEMAQIMNQSLSAAALSLGSALGEVSLIAGDDGLNGALKSLIVTSTALTHVYTGMLPEFAEANGLTSEFTNSINAAADALGVMATVIGAGALVKLAPMMYSYAAATALAAKNTLTAGTAAYTTTAGFAGLGGTMARTTVAMNAFGVATRFALGPWGLLITAVGAAAATFAMTRNEAEKTTEAIDDQAEAVKKMVENYDEMNKQGRDLFWVKSNRQILDLLSSLTDVNDKISALKDELPNADSGSRQDIRDEIEKLKERGDEYKETLETVRKAQGKIFAGGMPDNWKKPEGDGGDSSGVSATTSEIEKQITALKQMRQEVGMTSDELFIFRQQQKALATEEGEQFVGKVEDMSRAIVKARKNLRFDEQIDELSDLQKQVGKTSDELFVMNQVSKAQDAGFSEERIQKVREMAEAIVGARNAASETSEYEQWVESINNSQRTISDMTAEIEKLKRAIEMGDIDPQAGKQAIAGIREEMRQLSNEASLSQLFADGMGAAQQGAMAMREFADEGTKQYDRLTRAAQAFGVAQSLAAGNMLGAIAGAASLISSLGDYSFEDISAQVQANQNLNVWGEKSDSIDRSTEITANATEKLVGINTDMLQAFTRMDKTIAKAAGIISNDVSTPQVDIGGLGIMDNVFSFITDNPIADAFNKITLGLFSGVFDAIGGWLGGSSKVVDEGVRIFGGTLSDLMEMVAVQGYQVVKYKKWRFGSTKTSRKYTNLTDEVGGDIAEVFGHMGDAIAGGMEALGYGADMVDWFFEDFAKIGTSKLSLKGLSASEQAAELEAYFSKAFNTLTEQFDRNFTSGAIHSIKRIDEEYGEAFTRTVTQMQVLDQAVSDFGLSFGPTISEIKAILESDADMITKRNASYAEYDLILAADEMANLTGGLDEFIEKLNGFSSFASDAKNLEMLGGRLESRFSSMNMQLPDTADGLWELIQNLDGTTQAGREQIATILNLQDSAKAYYQLLDRENSRLLDERKTQLAESLQIAREQYDAEKERINLLKDGVNEQISALKEQKQLLDDNLSDAKSAVEDAYSAEIQAIRDAGQERVEQLNKERQAIADNVSMLQDVVSGTQKAIESAYSSPETVQRTLDAAINAARNGNFSPASSVDFGAAFAGNESFSTESEFLLAQAKTANKLAELGGLAETQKTIEERTLESIDAQVSATNEQTEKQVAQLEAQKRSLLGIEESTLSIYDASVQYRQAKSALDRLDYDSKLNYYESELERMDMLLESNQEVFDLHKNHYEKQIELLEEGNFTNKELSEMIAGTYESLEDSLSGGSSLDSVKDLGGYDNNPPPAKDPIKMSNEDLIKEIKQLREEQQIANAALAENTGRTANELQDIKFNGLETQ